MTFRSLGREVGETESGRESAPYALKVRAEGLGLENQISKPFFISRFQ